MCQATRRPAESYTGYHAKSRWQLVYRSHSVSLKRLKELLAYDPATGEFTWLVSPRANVPAGATANPKVSSEGYRQVGIDRVVYKAHRLAWFYTHGMWPPEDIDHINGIRHDNRIENLRPATRAMNVMNSKRRSDGGTSKYRGVSFHKSTKQWTANFRGKYLGIRRTEEAAHELYLAELRKLEPSFSIPLHPASIAA